MKVLLCIVFLFKITCSFSQQETEVNIYSFKAKTGETISLTHDQTNNLLIYRNSKNGTVEEIIDDLNDNIEVFHYSYYFRGGGKENFGLDLNSVHFEKDGFRYQITSQYIAAEDVTVNLLMIVDKTTGETFGFEGLNESVKGSLVSFRSNQLIPVSQE